MLVIVIIIKIMTLDICQKLNAYMSNCSAFCCSITFFISSYNNTQVVKRSSAIAEGPHNTLC